MPSSWTAGRPVALGFGKLSRRWVNGVLVTSVYYLSQRQNRPMAFGTHGENKIVWRTKFPSLYFQKSTIFAEKALWNLGPRYMDERGLRLNSQLEHEGLVIRGVEMQCF